MQNPGQYIVDSHWKQNSLALCFLRLSLIVWATSTIMKAVNMASRSMLKSRFVAAMPVVLPFSGVS